MNDPQPAALKLSPPLKLISVDLLVYVFLLFIKQVIIFRSSLSFSLCRVCSTFKSFVMMATTPWMPRQSKVKSSTSWLAIIFPAVSWVSELACAIKKKRSLRRRRRSSSWEKARVSGSSLEICFALHDCCSWRQQFCLCRGREDLEGNWICILVFHKRGSLSLSLSVPWPCHDSHFKVIACLSATRFSTWF